MAEFRKAHQFVVFCVHGPSQLALADFMQRQDWYAELAACEGTYFQLARYTAICEDADRVLAERLTREAGVASIPVSAFYSDGEDNRVLRFCFAKEEETLARAAERLCRL